MTANDYDAIIIGGGPAGLSAAIYTSRENMKTLVLDKGAFGGMAAITETIDNYPGFSKGVGGQQLIDEMTAQAERFGAKCETFSEVTEIRTVDSGYTVYVGNTTHHAKSVLLTTGSTFRKLDVPGEAELIGRGVHFCATCDAPLYKGKNVVVIGGGNSAMQESLFIARFAQEVAILVQGDTLTGSEVLRTAIRAEQHVKIHYNVSITGLTKPDPHGKIILKAADGETEQTMETDGVFVFIGLLPNSHPFEAAGLDERGFITSDDHFQTHLPGVFVAGDVRSGSTWQIASSVGEGVSAALVMRHYVDEHFPNWHRRNSTVT